MTQPVAQVSQRPSPDTMAAQPRLSQHLHSQTKEVIFNVCQYFEHEKQNGSPIESLKKVNLRAAAATCVTERTVENIRREARENVENNTPKFMSPKKRQRSKPIMDFFDDFNEGVLRRTVLQYYERKEIPTLDRIHEEMKNNLSYPGSREILRRVMKKIGFRFATVDGRKFLMEKDDVQYARSKFLSEMKKHLSTDKNIVYLDETWVNQNYTVPKCWVLENAGHATGVRVPSGKGSRLIILHAGTREGFVPGAALVFQAKNVGDYHDQMNAETFEKWFTDQLLPNIPPASVIVMDDASYHSRKLCKPPTASDNKSTIREWLEKKGVAVPQVILKTNLLHLVRQHVSSQDTNFVVDKIASEHNHTVVRLPPYHCQYNPIEMIWAQVKGYVAKRNTFKLAELKPLIQESLQHVTKENWTNAVSHAEKLQSDDAARDIVVDNFLDSFIITLTPSDEEDSS